jgi:hypothetical protein
VGEIAPKLPILTAARLAQLGGKRSWLKIIARGQIAPICAVHQLASDRLDPTVRETRCTCSWLGGATLPQVKPKARAAHENFHAL